MPIRCVLLGEINWALGGQWFDNIDVPYIVIKSNGQEVGRRELDQGLVIGRAPDCDVVVRDILLSRRHCRVQPSDDGWMVQDLGSKNGTFFNGERIRQPRVMKDNDVVRFGRSKVIFHAGLPEDDFAEQILAPTRPATPGDSLAGTLSGFTLLLPGEGDLPTDMPNPQPRPKDPPAYDKEELQTLLTAIASSSWDSVYSEARQPLRGDKEMAAEEELGPKRRRVRPSSPTDFSLQASPAAPAVEQREGERAEEAGVKAPGMGVAMGGARRWRRSGLPMHGVVAAIWVLLLVLMNLSRKPMANGSPRDIFPVASTGSVLRDENASGMDAELMKAADETLLNPPKTMGTMRFDRQAAQEAVKVGTAALVQGLW